MTRCIHWNPSISGLQQSRILKRNPSFQIGFFQTSQPKTSLLIPKLNARPLNTSLLLTLNFSSDKPDITQFLQTSAGLLFLYWFANFLVPDIVSKYFQFDKINEDQKSTDD